MKNEITNYYKCIIRKISFIVLGISVIGLVVFFNTSEVRTEPVSIDIITTFDSNVIKGYQVRGDYLEVLIDNDEWKKLRIKGSKVFVKKVADELRSMKYKKLRFRDFKTGTEKATYYYDSGRIYLSALSN